MRLRALLVLLLCGLAVPGSAWAHATLVKVVPESGAVLAKPPQAVRFVFDDDVRVGSGIKAIRNEGGASVLHGKAHVVGGRTLVVPLGSGLSDGDYTVLWRVVSDDGHTIAGVAVFGVGAGRPPPTAALSVRNGPSVKDVVSRWLLFAGLLTAVGAAFFRFTVAPVAMRVFLGAFLLVFIGVSGLLHDVPVASRFGGTMAAVALIAAFGAVFAAIAPMYPVLEPLVLTAAFLLLPAPSIAGHALDPGRSRLEFVDDLVHVAAASVWLGGLLALGLALRVGGDRGELMRRFSNIAVVAVAVLAITGVLRALSELSSFSQLWTTGYGRALVVKSALLVVLVAIGWLNRYRLVPQLRVDALRRNVAAELVLFAGLIVAVAFLTDLRPGRDRAAAAAVVTGPPPLPARDMVVQPGPEGVNAVGFATRPGRAEVTVLGPDGQGVNGLDVTIKKLPAKSCGSGCYSYSGQLGRWVEVRINGRLIRFWVPPRVGPAERLVARATRVFRALRSVDYVERLASSPRNKVVSDFTLERPNRLEYKIHGGASGIIIGGRRWDRAQGQPWVESGQTPLPQPEPIWAGRITNAHVIDRNADEYAVTFMRPLGPTWFLVYFDRRTLRPVELTMTTAAHFMTHRYTRFNARPRIKAPTGAR